MPKKRSPFFGHKNTTLRAMQEPCAVAEDKIATPLGLQEIGYSSLPASAELDPSGYANIRQINVLPVNAPSAQWMINVIDDCRQIFCFDREMLSA
ncbi:hypothetical protein JNB91_00915 [Rhizobium wenxiniae]|uniref:hypothetical protein n=1 Tax=Rhizobium wenxiniae TaxID=1737357 RepID=UPI001C6EA882|nr:hypothetical protein [Rhizobium wenxiniae]MBW9086389.1 hypothetical protein [Rhizobium wenxiniae]